MYLAKSMAFMIKFYMNNHILYGLYVQNLGLLCGLLIHIFNLIGYNNCDKVES